MHHLLPDTQRTVSPNRDHGQVNLYGSDSEEIYSQQCTLSSSFISPLLACALQLPQVGTFDKCMKTVLVLQVGGGDRENLCSVCRTLC